MTRAGFEPALAAIERALRARPSLVYNDLVDAVRELVAARDNLIAERRRGDPDPDKLDRVNALLSLLASAEYPLEGVRWERIEAARRELADLEG